MKKLSENVLTAIKTLRLRGYTHRQIAKLLQIGLGSTVNYSRGIQLNPSQKKRLNKYNYNKSLGKLSMEQRIFTSRKGGINSPNHFLSKYKRTQIIEIFQKFYKENGRIPTKRDFVGLYRAVLRIFGTWNNAIKKAGFVTNPVLFSKKHVANDGHKCDSLAEKIIDDYLFARKIHHERNVRYANTKYTTDFKINNTYIEFFGLVGQLKSYDILFAKKKLLVRQLGLRLISIYPEDIFPKSRLEQILTVDVIL